MQRGNCARCSFDRRPHLSTWARSEKTSNGIRSARSLFLPRVERVIIDARAATCSDCASTRLASNLNALWTNLQVRPEGAIVRLTSSLQLACQRSAWIDYCCSSFLVLCLPARDSANAPSPAFANITVTSWPLLLAYLLQLFARGFCDVELSVRARPEYGG